MLEVKKAWQTLHDSFPERSWSKENIEERTTMLHGVLKSRLSQEDMAALAATCGTLAVDEDQWSDFDRSVIEALLEVFATSEDRENLVKLLSIRCPSQYGVMNIEGYLVHIGAKELKDSVQILGEAYSRCQVPEVRKVIATAVRRGFKGFGIRGNDDAEFVQRAMTWYEQQKAQLVFNPEYPTTIDAHDLHSYWKRPLFKWKSPSGANRAGTQAFQVKDRTFARAGQPESLKEITNSIGMQMILIPAGDFMMGAPEDEKGHRENEIPQHPVRITKPFWLGVYEVNADRV